MPMVAGRDDRERRAPPPNLQAIQFNSLLMDPLTVLCIDMVCVRDTGRWGLGPGALKIQEDIQYFTGLSNAVCILASASIIMSHNQDPCA